MFVNVHRVATPCKTFVSVWGARGDPLKAGELTAFLYMRSEDTFSCKTIFEQYSLTYRSINEISPHICLPFYTAFVCVDAQKAVDFTCIY